MNCGSPEEATVALLIVTSERKFYLNLLILSLRLHKLRHIDHVLVVDTSTVPRRWRGESFLRSSGRGYEVFNLPGTSVHQVLRTSWSHLAHNVGATHVLMFEEDFVLLKNLPIERLLALANENGTLQVVLPRQRWFEAEYAYPDRTTYLRATHDFLDTPEGDRLIGFFTNNPHCMSLERILPLVEDVAPSDEYTWESSYASASAIHGMSSLQIRSSRPWVWHIGAATSLGARAAVQVGRSTWTVYPKAHAKRALVVIGRQVKQLLRGWKQ